jgi:hypothetical protein
MNVSAIFFQDLPRALGIWSLLLLVAVGIFAILIAPPRKPKAAMVSPVQGPALKRTRLTAEAQDLSRHATRLNAIAEQAEQIAGKRRSDWLSALAQSDQTWQAFSTGEAEARRLLSTLALPEPLTPKTPAEYAEREKYLHRSAMRACSHRELSALELSDALAHRNGWDPTLHPLEQEVALRKRVRDSLFTAHQIALGKEAKAWDSAQLAATAARNLRQEAFRAASQAQEIRQAAHPVTMPVTVLGVEVRRPVALARARGH